MKKVLLSIFFFLIIIPNKVSATHLLGGELAYQFIKDQGNGKMSYKISAHLYRDCATSSLDFDSFITIGIYSDSATYPWLQTVKLLLKSQQKLPVICGKAGTCIKQGYYEEIIVIDTSKFGYHLYNERCCRPVTNNLKEDQGFALYAFLMVNSLKNSSPQFKNPPRFFYCMSDTVNNDNQILDIDQDEAYYFTTRPLSGGTAADPFPGASDNLNWPLRTVKYNSGFSEYKPFSNYGSYQINSATGMELITANRKGRYAISFDLVEYRNGVVIGITKRNITIFVLDLCEANKPPRLSVAQQGTKSSPYQIVAGDKFCFSATFIDSVTQNISTEVNGEVFSGITGVASPWATVNMTSAPGSSTVDFCWQTGPQHINSLPYEVNMISMDDGCLAATNVTTFFMKVSASLAIDKKIEIRLAAPFPNPSSTFFTIDPTYESVVVYKVDGSQLTIKLLKPGVVDVSDWSNGLYVIQTKNKGAVFSYKMMVQH